MISFNHLKIPFDVDNFEKLFNKKNQPYYRKIQEVTKYLDIVKVFKCIDEKITIKIDKYDEISEKLRDEGDCCIFQNDGDVDANDTWKAYKLYNESICYAESKMNLAKGFKARSDILFRWKNYNECLENIELAKDYGYPKNLTLAREEECRKRLLELKDLGLSNLDKIRYLQVSYPPHRKIPFVADCIEIGRSTEYGRFIYTTKNLYPGDVISIENNFESCLMPHEKYLHCYKCKKESLTLIPCSSCTSIMYCNENCKQEDITHKYECPCIDLLFQLFNDCHLLTLRVVLSILAEFKTIEECKQFINDPENQNLDAFKLNYMNFSKKEYLKCILGLVSNEEKRSTEDLFKKATAVAIIKHYLLKQSLELKKTISDEDEEFLSELLFKSMLLCSENGFSLTHYETVDDKNFPETYGAGIFGFSSLMTHSCAPNVEGIFKNSKIYVIVLRPIEKNGIIYNSYGQRYDLHEREKRIIKLKNNYHFICKCEACVNDYNLKTIYELPELITEDDKKRLKENNREIALKIFNLSSSFLKKYSTCYPCNQIVMHEHYLRISCSMLIDSFSLFFKTSRFDCSLL